MNKDLFFQVMEKHTEWYKKGFPDEEISKRMYFEGSYFSHFNLDSKNLSQAIFKKVNFENMEIARCTFCGTEFNQITCINVSFYRCRFNKAKLDSCNFINCTFEDCKFEDTGAPHIWFDNCTINDCDFERAQLNKAKFTYCLLGDNTCILNSDLVGALVAHCTMKFITVHGVNMESSSVQNSSFASIGFFRDSFKSSTIKNSKFITCSVMATNLKYAIFYNNEVLNMTGFNDCNISSFDISNSIGIMSQTDFLKNNFEFTKDGMIAYKTFDLMYTPNPNWEIAEGSIITENVNFDRTNDCGCGINVAPLEWVISSLSKTAPIWKVLIKWEWLAGVCVPYDSDGKIRCEKVQLLNTIDYTFPPKEDDDEDYEHEDDEIEERTSVLI